MPSAIRSLSNPSEISIYRVWAIPADAGRVAGRSEPRLGVIGYLTSNNGSSASHTLSTTMR